MIITIIITIIISITILTIIIIITLTTIIITITMIMTTMTRYGGGVGEKRGGHRDRASHDQQSEGAGLITLG